MVGFSERLKELRKGKKLSQEQLARQVGVSKSMISGYENSIRMPSYEVLVRLALVFNVSIDYFFGFKKCNRYLDVTGLSESQLNVVSLLIDEFKNT